MASRLNKSIALLAALPMLVVSCVDSSFDLDKIDSEMTLFSNGITIPVGSTGKIFLDKVFDIEAQGGDFLSTDADGNYVFTYSNKDAGLSADISIPEMNFQNAISIESNTDVISTGPFAGQVLPDGLQQEFTLKQLDIPIEMDVEVPDGISAIDWIEMSSSMQLIISANVPIVSLKEGYSIVFPDFLILEAQGEHPDFVIENGHTIKFVNTVKCDEPKSFSVSVTKMDIAKLPAGQGVQNGRLVVSQKAHTEGNTLLAVGDGSSAVPAQLELSITGAIDNAQVSKIRVKADKSVDIPASVTKLSNLPEFLQESTIQFDDCVVKFLLDNSSPFDFALNATISSTKAGKVNSANIQNLQVKQGHNEVYLSAGGGKAPAGGVDYIIPNINDIFGSMPEQISIENAVAAVSGKEFIELPSNVQGKISAGFEFTAPLSFQADGELSLDVEMTDLNLNLDSFGAEAIEIKFDAQNAIPLDFTINCKEAYDQDGTRIQPVLNVSQAIKAGTQSKPTTTPVTLGLSAPGVKSVGRITLTLTAKSLGGVSLNKNQYLQIGNIVASLPNGITIK